MLSDEEANLLTLIEKLGDEAKEKGWELTKKALAAPIPERSALTEAAKAAYELSLATIAQSLLVSTSEEMLRGLRQEVIKTNINVFDLYRRVERLPEARELGEKTLEDALKLGATNVTLRAGNFLTLVQSAEAYAALGKCEYTEALNHYRTVEKSFDAMPLQKAVGKNAGMLYVNQAYNYLNIVEVSVRYFGKRAAELESTLNKVDHAVHQAAPFVASMENVKDQANWKANICTCKGRAAQYRGLHEQARVFYEEGLSIAPNAGYPTLIVCFQTRLAHVLATKQEPDLVEARKQFSKVQIYLKTNTFGSDELYFRPLIAEIEAHLGGA